MSQTKVYAYPPSVWHVAKKEYKCSVCSSAILPGETYGAGIGFVAKGEATVPNTRSIFTASGNSAASRWSRQESMNR